MPELEICFTPALYDQRGLKENYITVVVDVLRATTAMCAAIENGVEAIIPVGSLDEAKAQKQEGYLIAAERDGVVLDFADFGNSPFNFQKESVKGKTIAYSTTNGTKAIKKVSVESEEVVMGAFSNLSVLADYLIRSNKNVLIVCSGWKGRFNLEDSVFAGALSEKLLNNSFHTNCDSVKAALDLWEIARKDLLAYAEKTSHRHRLKKLVLDDVLEYCFTLDTVKFVPVLQNGRICKKN